MALQLASSETWSVSLSCTRAPFCTGGTGQLPLSLQILLPGFSGIQQRVCKAKSQARSSLSFRGCRTQAPGTAGWLHRPLPCPSPLCLQLPRWVCPMPSHPCSQHCSWLDREEEGDVRTAALPMSTECHPQASPPQPDLFCCVSPLVSPSSLYLVPQPTAGT